jgi:hypothetical protein
MRGSDERNTSRLYSVSDSFGDAQIVAVPERVILDLQSRNYDSEGRVHKGHALADMSLTTAIRLRELLGEAIAVATGAIPVQPGLWSEATIRHIAQKRRS